MIVAITGATGNMGQATVDQLLKIPEVEKLKLLALSKDKRLKELLKRHKKDKEKIEIVFGNVADKSACEKLVENVDYVINMAAVIPPHSDQHPEKAIECNEVGTKTLIGVIEKMKKQPKFIHISTMALYGNRNSLHPWGRVGDPLLFSPFDIYAITKMRGEFCVLESNIENFAVLRQTAMLHSRMLADNMSDGLMFHTCFNAPLEWVTAHDSGVLVAHIIQKDMKEDLSKTFWKRVFNISGGLKNCITGFDTLNDGFKLIGGSAKDFFEPNFNATRNFHGMWFYDGNKLEDMFHYQSQSTEDFWKELDKANPYFKLGKLVPKKLIKRFAIKRLFKSPNSPKYWQKHNDEAKLFAYFGGKDKYAALPDWKDFGLFVENKDEMSKQLNYAKLKDKNGAKLVDFGIDIDSENLSIKDLEKYAQMHGGKLLSTSFKSMYDKLVWQNSDGQQFEARPYTVVKAGHFLNRSYTENVWDFDRLAKKDKIYAQIWYDTHGQNEDKLYSYDKNFMAKMEKI